MAQEIEKELFYWQAKVVFMVFQFIWNGLNTIEQLGFHFGQDLPVENFGYFLLLWILIANSVVMIGWDYRNIFRSDLDFSGFDP